MRWQRPLDLPMGCTPNNHLCVFGVQFVLCSVHFQDRGVIATVIEMFKKSNLTIVSLASSLATTAGTNITKTAIVFVH